MSENQGETSEQVIDHEKEALKAKIVELEKKVKAYENELKLKKINEENLKNQVIELRGKAENLKDRVIQLQGNEVMLNAKIMEQEAMLENAAEYFIVSDYSDDDEEGTSLDDEEGTSLDDEEGTNVK